MLEWEKDENKRKRGRNWPILFLKEVCSLHETLRTVRIRFLLPASVTRSGDFLDFGQLFKAFGNN